MNRITIAKGDGIGPEIMDAVLDILQTAGADLAYDEIEIGEKSYLAGNSSGISPEAWETLRKNKIFLKAPITTPLGGGYKSLNVTIRKTLGLYANVRPCRSWHPFVQTKHPEMDLVIIRENEEDLYAGIEHQQTHEVVQCLKLISRPGCEKIVRYAFEYAKKYNRKKVTCFTKDNIMKQTDGLFKRVFNEIAEEYPEIEKEHWIIDIGAAKIADTPEHFDVVVMPNLYGDVVSDITAQIAGSVGLAGSSNIGEGFAMFEAIHGSATDIAGQQIANPSGLLNGAILMLLHMGQSKIAEKIQNAWAVTIEEGFHTADIYKEGMSRQKVSTRAFAEAIKANLGKVPTKIKAASYPDSGPMILPKVERGTSTKELKGVDMFVDWSGSNANELGEKLQNISTKNLKISMITNRGVKVWPNGFDETFCTDHWRCRFVSEDNVNIAPKDIIWLMHNANENGIDVIKTENLYDFDGKQAYSMGQGQ